MSSSTNINVTPSTAYIRNLNHFTEFKSTVSTDSYYGLYLCNFNAETIDFSQVGSAHELAYCPIFIGHYSQSLISNFFIPDTINSIPSRIDFSGTINTGESAPNKVNFVPSTTNSVYSLVFVKEISNFSSLSIVGISYYEYDDSGEVPYLRLVANSWDSENPQSVRFDEPLFPILCVPVTPDSNVSPSSNVVQPFTNFKIQYTLPVSAKHVVLTDNNVTSPYFGVGNTGDNTIKISALPYRAYESVYNAFYRSSQGVQPFVVDGVTKYNKYVTTDDDGADTTNYSLFERNWELDAYTSCLISPQQGNVPYVGITDISALGRMSVETPDGETAEVRLNDLKDGVEISNLHGTSPEARAYALRAASSGFTIPEFREANALQRFS